MPEKVVIIDDDLFHFDYYQAEFATANFSAVHVKTTGALRPILRHTRHADAAFFIVDMMMPPGTLYESEPTHHGLLTGLFVARDLRDAYPDTPIVLWTFSHVQLVKDAAKKLSLRIPDCVFTEKMNASPEELTSALDHHRRTGHFKKSLFIRLWNALALRPNVAGVGIDLKELTK